MDAIPPPAQPTWVHKRDGSREPFDADKINRSLFAAGERLEHADAFVARELTDSVLHFLTTSGEGGTITSSQLAETVAKVVRELGQPQLAAAYLQRLKDRHDSTIEAASPPGTKHQAPDTRRQLRLDPALTAVELHRQLACDALKACSLSQVFSRNLASAQEEGLLVLDGLESPLELDSAVIRPASGGGFGWASGIFEVMEQARGYVGRSLAIDAPEREFVQRGARIGDAAIWIKELARGGRTHGIEVIVNLGGETSPPWAAETSTGPLFAEQAKHESSQGMLAFLEALTDHMLHLPAGAHLRLDWHLAARDFEDEIGRRRLLRLLRAGLQGKPLTFVCDRPKREVSLAEGLDRNHQAALLWVGLHLPKLLLRQGRLLDADSFVNKVMSLARLAASAGVQKRDFLRRHGRHERPAFLLERAHLVVHLIGLAEVTRTVLGDDATPAAVSSFAHDLVRRLDTALGQEARHTHLKCLVDELPGSDESMLAADGEDLPTRLKQIGKWHAALGRGTVSLCLSPEQRDAPEQLLEVLQHTWRHTQVNRIRLSTKAARQTQLTAEWQPDV